MCFLAGTNATAPLKTYGAPKQGVPVSVDFVSTDPQLMVAAYAPGTAHIIDVVRFFLRFLFLKIESDDHLFSGKRQKCPHLQHWC